MNGNKSAVKFKCILFLEQMLVAPSVSILALCRFGIWFES